MIKDFRKRIMKISNQQMIRETIAYLFWGGITTIINIAVFLLIRQIPGMPAVVANIIAWSVSIIFAFITNRHFVFNSGKLHGFPLPVQFAFFILTRLLSGSIETLTVFLMIDILLFADLPVKIFSNGLIIVINYIAGKLLVFRKVRQSGTGIIQESDK